MSETPQGHEHDIVSVMSADETQVRDYCRACGHRGPWRELPPELQPPADLTADGDKG